MLKINQTFRGWSLFFSCFKSNSIFLNEHLKLFTSHCASQFSPIFLTHLVRTRGTSDGFFFFEPVCADYASRIYCTLGLNKTHNKWFCNEQIRLLIIKYIPSEVALVLTKCVKKIGENCEAFTTSRLFTATFLNFGA